MLSWDGDLNGIVKGIAMGKKIIWKSQFLMRHAKMSSANELTKSLGSEIIY